MSSVLSSAVLPEAYLANKHLFPPEERDLAERLIAENQRHLFENWGGPGEGDAKKQAFLKSLSAINRSYPGGLLGYIRNARELLAAAVTGSNPYEGYTPEQPEIADLTGFGEEYAQAEEAGRAAFAQTAVVLVAGGLGERLGYSGIKLDIPVEVTRGTSYLAHYAEFLRAASQTLARPIPLVIMTSQDTHAGTVASLAAHKNFGLEDGQITILRQELVPALDGVDARLALEAPCELILKPHGHGDIHMLLHTSGTAKKLAAEGIRHLLFIQDTNGQVFNAALAAIGVSELRGYDFNSIAVHRVPGEAVGGITTLVKPGAPRLTINVEYNQLDPLLRATVSPEGDVPNEKGFSRFPGNINLLVIRMDPYLRLLEASGGIIAEFVNPKFADDSRTTFKKPARLETMMQDLPKLFVSGEKVGVTIFDRAWCFSPCKNNLGEAAGKAARNSPPESASSAESDFYLAGRMKARFAGMQVTDAPVRLIQGIPFTPGPRILLQPSFALTLAEVKQKIRGGGISGAGTLILDGDIALDNVTIRDGASLVITAVRGAKVRVRDLEISGDPGYQLEELTSEEMASKSQPEYLRIRGYRIVDPGVKKIEILESGLWEVDKAGARKILPG
ncbi:MAG: UTP--glucose-1-phosphate uridylyltransferase [Chthoniobacterales bacterium]|nr:UTP--glucose-1-phosphate uridylyltransferase [Chthoniobacterales bacterium]